MKCDNNGNLYELIAEVDNGNKYNQIKSMYERKYGEPHYILECESDGILMPEKIFNMAGPKNQCGWIFGDKFITITDGGNRPDDEMTRLPFTLITYTSQALSQKFSKLLEEEREFEWKENIKKSTEDL